MVQYADAGTVLRTNRVYFSAKRSVDSIITDTADTHSTLQVSNTYGIIIMHTRARLADTWTGVCRETECVLTLL